MYQMFSRDTAELWFLIVLAAVTYAVASALMSGGF